MYGSFVWGAGTVAFTLNPMSQSTELHWIDYLIMLIFGALTFFAAYRKRSSNDKK
jgi:hypothetical protein